MPEYPGGEQALKKYLAENIKYPQWKPDLKDDQAVEVTFILPISPSALKTTIF